MAGFLEKVNQLVIKSDGRFDPTVGSLIARWKIAFNHGEIPDRENVTGVGWHLIHYDNNFFWKDCDETTLDLCGCAKGYSVDLIVERLMALGYSDLFVSWGGDIRCEGKHPSGRKWTVAIRSGDDGIAACIPLQGAIATSGHLEQHWEADGKTFTHIYNPLTSSALEVGSLISVTVKAKTCLEADGLATAAMISPREVEKKNPQAQFWILQ